MSHFQTGNIDDTENLMRLAMSLSRKGCASLIKKPLPTAGRTLDRVIKKVWHGTADPVRMDRHHASDTTTPPAKPVAAKEPAPALSEKQNQPVTLDEFMAMFCEKRSKEARRCRRKALQAAARNGGITLPPLAEPHSNGRAKKYFSCDLLAAWESYRDAGVDLPVVVTPGSV